MGYPAQIGIPVSVLHPVRDIDGNYVAGQASAIVKNLLKPDRTVDAVTVVTKIDLATATGWVQATFTPSLLGTYLLELTNPGAPTADGRTEPYNIIVGAGISASQALLTSLDRVRNRMDLKNSSGQPIQPGEVHILDPLLNFLISEVSEEYQAILGRTFAETDYIVYLDGTNRPSLVLPAGPIASFTSLEWVDYQDDGAGGVTEVRTIVPRSSYVLAGLASQPRFRGLGRIDLIGRGAVFTSGPKRYRVVFRAGFSTIPEGLVGLATEDVVFRAASQKTSNLLSQVLGDGQVTYMRPQQMVELRETRLAPYLLEAA